MGEFNHRGTETQREHELHELARMKKLLSWIRRRRPHLEAVQLISEGRLAEMFKAAPDSPLWKATLAVVDLEVQEGLEECLDEKLSTEVLRHRIGMVAGMLAVKAALLEREHEARKVETEKKTES